MYNYFFVCDIVMARTLFSEELDDEAGPEREESDASVQNFIKPKQ